MSALDDLEIKLAVIKHVRDVSYWKLPEGTPIVPHPDPTQLGDAPIGSKFYTGSPDQPDYHWTKTGPDQWKAPGYGTGQRTAYTKHLLEYQRTSKNKTALVKSSASYGDAESGKFKAPGQFGRRDQESYNAWAKKAGQPAVGEGGRFVPKSEPAPKKKSDLEIDVNQRWDEPPGGLSSDPKYTKSGHVVRIRETTRPGDTSRNYGYALTDKSGAEVHRSNGGFSNAQEARNDAEWKSQGLKHLKPGDEPFTLDKINRNLRSGASPRQGIPEPKSSPRKAAPRKTTITREEAMG
jgi:hypothetical protein